MVGRGGEVCALRKTKKRTAVAKKRPNTHKKSRPRDPIIEY